jgi:hypothetical protein
MLKYRGIVSLISVKILTIAFLLIVAWAGVHAQQKSNDGCPKFKVIGSANTAVIGDKLTYNIVVKGGTLNASELKFDWDVYPRGQITASQDTKNAVLDTSTVNGNWAIVSVRFADFRRCYWHASSGDINIRRKGPYSKVDEFWWWFQRNREHFRAYKMPEYKLWLWMLKTRLKAVDGRFSFTIDHERVEKRALIIDAKPHDATLLKELADRAPDLASWQFIFR